MRRLLALCLFVIACGSSGPGGPQPTITDGPPLSGDKYELTWGPVQVAPGHYHSACVSGRFGATTHQRRCREAGTVEWSASAAPR